MLYLTLELGIECIHKRFLLFFLLVFEVHKLQKEVPLLWVAVFVFFLASNTKNSTGCENMNVISHKVSQYPTTFSTESLT